MSYSPSLEKYSGKVAVVTGASAGIGKAIAECLVKQGLIVAGLARRVQRIKDHTDKLKNEKGKLYAFDCDLTKTDHILDTFKKITEQLGPISVLVNNAGLALRTNLCDGDVDKWKTMLDTNVMAVAVCTREAIASMKKGNINGHIININSMAGHQILDQPGLSLYPASKYAVTAMTETLRLEINREKLPIKVTSLSPGYVKTEFVEVAFGEEASKKINGQPGMEPKDIAEGVLYILSTPDHVNVKELTIFTHGYLC